MFNNIKVVRWRPFATKLAMQDHAHHIELANEVLAPDGVSFQLHIWAIEPNSGHVGWLHSVRTGR